MCPFFVFIINIYTWVKTIYLEINRDKSSANQTLVLYILSFVAFCRSTDFSRDGILSRRILSGHLEVKVMLQANFIWDTDDDDDGDAVSDDDNHWQIRTARVVVIDGALVKRRVWRHFRELASFIAAAEADVTAVVILVARQQQSVTCLPRRQQIICLPRSVPGCILPTFEPSHGIRQPSTSSLSNFYSDRSPPGPELDTGRVHSQVGSGLVGSGCVTKFSVLGGSGWVRSSVKIYNIRKRLFVDYNS